MNALEQIEYFNKQLDAAIEDNDIQKISSILTKMWLITQIVFTQITSPELKELNFLKTPIDIGKGKYLLSFMHVDGEKIKLREDT